MQHNDPSIFNQSTPQLGFNNIQGQPATTSQRHATQLCHCSKQQQQQQVQQPDSPPGKPTIASPLMLASGMYRRMLSMMER
jgi:hypothetical protein